MNNHATLLKAESETYQNCELEGYAFERRDKPGNIEAAVNIKLPYSANTIVSLSVEQDFTVAAEAVGAALTAGKHRVDELMQAGRINTAPKGKLKEPEPAAPEASAANRNSNISRGPKPFI